MVAMAKADGVHAKPAQRLFIPGPTDVLPEVLAAQTAPMIGHRTDEFETLFAKIQHQMCELFQTAARVYVVAATGSAMHEAAIRNCVHGRVLNFINGAFSKRWHDVARGCDKSTVAVDVEWNKAVTPHIVETALRSALEEGPVDAITVVHNETSTGVISPINEIAKVVRAVSPGTLVLVDAVSSFAGTAIPFDEWELDVCLTSSQKAMAVPPGLAFCAVSDRALARAEDVAGRGWYLDFLNLEKYLKRDTTPATPAISLMRALSVQLDHIFDEGTDARYARHTHLAQMTQDWVMSRGFELAAPPGFRSPTVTNVQNNLAIDVPKLNEYLRSHEMEISDGYGAFKGKAFRIAHMGEASEQDMARLFDSIQAFLEQ